ncbi:hypothetical protein N0V90_004307 [Kalmusia sp. IMI 367209]|nr:hypothetical protein N0V90_004307 [Kalmusia sp. IMI 367209]
MVSLNLGATFQRQDLFFNGCTYGSDALAHPLLKAARRAPQDIDAHLQPYLYSHTFPTELERLMKKYVSTMATPGLQDGALRSRPRWFYANCAVFGMLLGRAFARLSTPVRPPKSLDVPHDFPFSKLPAELRLIIFEYYKEDLAQRQRYWAVMTRMFVKALWSGRDPEEGARFTAGIVMLTSGHAMSSCAPLLQGRGARYVWWEDAIKELDHVWTFHDLRSALLATKRLPRNNTDFLHVFMTDPSSTTNPYDRLSDYVSNEVLEALDLARGTHRGWREGLDAAGDRGEGLKIIVCE